MKKADLPECSMLPALPKRSQCDASSSAHMYACGYQLMFWPCVHVSLKRPPATGLRPFLMQALQSLASLSNIIMLGHWKLFIHLDYAAALCDPGYLA